MTTIFADARLGVMVADSLFNVDGRQSYGPKVFRVGGSLVGGAGSWPEIHGFVRWLREGCAGPRPKLKSSEILVLDADGLWYYDASVEPVPIDQGYEAVGTGALCFLGAYEAMNFTNPTRAMEIAMNHDLYTGGRIQVEHLNGTKNAEAPSV